MDAGFVSTTRLPIALTLLLRASIWVIVAGVGVTPTPVVIWIVTTTGNAVTVTRTTAGAVTNGTTVTATCMAETTGMVGTGANVAAPLPGRATRRSTDAAGATPGALRVVAALAAVATTTLRLPALCLLTATPAGEATVR